MRLKLGIGAIPPAASHTAVLLLGVTVANLAAQDAERARGVGGMRLKPLSIVMALPAHTIQPEVAAASRVPAEVAVVRTGPDGACRLAADPVPMIAGRPWPLIALGGRNRPAPADLERLAREHRLQLLPAAQGVTSPVCQPSSGVTYGPDL